MLVERYSNYGFKPQTQSHHLSTFVFPHIYDWDEVVKSVPEFMIHSVTEKHNQLTKFYSEHYTDLKEGIWVFPYGCKTNKCLNHIKGNCKAWVAELPDDTTVYDVNWEHTMKLSDPRCKLFGCYVPKRALNDLTNVQLKTVYKKYSTIKSHTIKSA